MGRCQRAPRAIQEGLLYTLLLLLPFSNAAIEITFGGLLLAWLWERADRRTRANSVWWSPRQRPFVVSLLAYLGVCALSIAVSDYPALGVRGFWGKWTEYLLLCVIAADVGRRAGVLRQGLGVVACSSLLVAVEGITQERFGRGLFRGYRLDFFDRMTGPYQNPGDLGTYLMVVIPILLAWGASHRTALGRVASWGVVGVLTVCLARTMCVGAWVGAGLGVAVMAVLGRARSRRYALVWLVGVPVVCGWLVQRGGVLPDWVVLDKGSVKRAGGFQQASWSEAGVADRWVMWQAALRMIRDRPILGHGLNTFMANYLKYWVGGERQPRYAHNCYLQVAAETGIMGLLSFVWVLALFFLRLLRALRNAHPREGILLLGFLAGLLAFVIQAAIDTNFYSLRQSALFWTLAGLATGLAISVESRGTAREMGS